MKKKFLRMVCVMLTVVLATVCTGTFPAFGATQSQLRNQIAGLESQSKDLEAKIKKLKSENADQSAIAKAIQSKINNTQQQITLCNNEISKINSTISANKAEIQAKNDQIDADKLTFKKRIRAIYMSSTDNAVQILMGADSFSDYLQLSQLTSAVSSHDKALIQKIAAAVKELQAKLAENEKLLEEQVTVKQTIAAKQAELKSEQAEVQQAMNAINAQTQQLNTENKNVEAEILAAKKELEKQVQNNTSATSFVYTGDAFAWPVPGFYNLTQQFGHNGHTGIDISSGGISGKPIVAVADGVVYMCKNNWDYFADGVQSNNSYGNYVAINHGTLNGTTYKAWYAHMSSVAVSNGQTVKKGQTIGYVGTTGNSTGYHLHFAVMINNSWTNPMNFYKKAQ